MYYSQKELEDLRKKGEEQAKAIDKKKEGLSYTLNGDRPFQCLCCGQTSFHKGSALLNTRGMTFLGFDWLNDAATTLICTDCGYIHWFAKDIHRLP